MERFEEENVRTGIVFDFERSADLVIRVGIHAEVERRSVALGSVVVVRCQDFDNFARRNVFRQHRTVILQEPESFKIDKINFPTKVHPVGLGVTGDGPWSVVVDVLDDDGQRSRGCFGR